MKEIDISTIIGIVTTFILILLASFLLSVKSKNKVSNKLFATFLILFALDICDSFIHLFYNDVSSSISIFRNIRYLMPSVQIPVFYLYFLSVCYSDFKLQKKHLWHLLPFVLLNLVYVPRFYMADLANRIFIIDNFKNSFEFILSHIIMQVLIYPYALACFFVLKKAKKIFFENHSSNVIQTYHWLTQLLVSFVILYTVALIKNILKFTNYSALFNVFQLIVILLVLVTICWYILKALKHPDIFNGVNSTTVLTKNLTKINGSKTSNKNLNALKSFMISNEPYLSPSLNIRNLAQQLKIPARELSILINQDLNQHFFDFINEYRINKAKEILKDASKNKLTILEILYEVGFNSKSSFNTAFRKHTHQTPTEFRKSFKS